ncbi:MAG: hypothetical protein KAH17_07355 [Bacteroidales bacterium]|nr:hypothetical protein [Bacteroidales bacterium]
MQKSIFIILFLVFSLSLSGQSDSLIRVKYTPEFRFHDGIFLHFNQVKNNKPIPASLISSNTDPYDMNFFKNLVEEKNIVYFDAFGSQNEVSTDNIWGFAQDGKLYINYNGEFNRIPIIGRIGHFIADITVYESFNDPYRSDYSSYYYNSYSNRPYNRPSRSKEMRQYIVNFETGQVLDYERAEVKVILMEDPELFDEFSGLRKRKQKDLMFFFIRRYNEKHPLFFPIN